jgi:hypothetical protein
MIRFKDIAARITGVSIPIFGISWNPPESEREVIREIFVFLEDRRVLYSPYFDEIESEVNESLLRIRDELTQALRRLSETSEAAHGLRAMRSACRTYLEMTTPFRHGPFAYPGELRNLRARFGFQLAHLAIQYGIDVEDDLAAILPRDVESWREWPRGLTPAAGDEGPT